MASFSGTYDVIDIWEKCGQFGTTWKPDAGFVVRKTYVFINSNLSS